MHIIWRKSKNQRILTGIDNGRGFPGNLLTSHKIFDILCNNNLHTIILTDTLSQLKHEIQRKRILCVNKYMGLVDYHNNLPGCMVFFIVIPVFDNLIIQPLQHQQHLRIGNKIVAVCQQ